MRDPIQNDEVTEDTTVVPENKRKVKKTVSYWFDDPEGEQKRFTIVFYENGVVGVDMVNKTKPRNSYRVFMSKRTALVLLKVLREELK